MFRVMKSVVLLAGALTAAVAATAPASAQDLAQQERNRELVVKFYDGVFNQHQVEKNVVVLADDYRQHNPMVANGKKPFVDFFTGYFQANPASHARIVRSAANDDLVWLHIHSTNGARDPGRAIVDIFRVKDGKIVEHWDVIQPVPDKSANDNTMF